MRARRILRERDEDFELHYGGADVRPDSVPDVVCTYERFGNSALREPFNESYFAQPLILLRPRVAAVLKRQRVRAVAYDRVRLVD